VEQVDSAVVVRRMGAQVVVAVDIPVVVAEAVHPIGVQAVAVDHFLPRVQRRQHQLRDTKQETVLSPFNT
jgi:hypothetical protein